MVKNTQGGSKTKGLSRKMTNPTFTEKQFKITDPLQRMATVTKMYGNGMCQVLTHESPQLDLMCHIRGAFRGRSKKHNLVINGATVVIGLREWETPSKNCDLLHVPSNSVSGPSSTTTTHKNPTDTNADDFIFSTCDEEEEAILATGYGTKEDYLEEENEINIDDI